MAAAGECFASGVGIIRECNSNCERCSLTLHGLPAGLEECFAQDPRACNKDLDKNLWRGLWGGYKQETGRGRGEMLTIEVGGERFAFVTSNFSEERT
jgi:hypothetical protein